jgi:NADPH:quinone reductase-like Zn-dependent oxidoreductase
MLKDRGHSIRRPTRHRTVYPFADAISAFRHLERGAFGKVVIRVQA